VVARHRYNETVLPPTCTQHPWTAPDGATFSYSHWPAEGDAKFVMIAVHGLSGAAMDYEPLGSRIAQMGFATYAPELRGQGNDPLPARRGDLDRLETWFTDLGAFIALVRAENPGLPIYYYGESMGAAILTRFLAQAEPDQLPAALILASPVIAIQQPTPMWLNIVFRTLLFVWPTYRVDVRKLAKREKVQRHVTRDEAHREWFATAPHKLDAFTLRFFRCLHDLISGCFDAAPRIRVPVLVIYAQHDIFIRTDLVEQFFARLGSADKELTLYPDSYHLLLHDHDREQVLERITDWLQKPFSARSAGAARNS
jgi:alpha-beta hydrolase superfamily lysophospholipase